MNFKDETALQWPTNTPCGSPLYKANSSTANLNIPRVLRKPNVHYHANESPPFVRITSQINPVHTHAYYFFQINFNIIFPSRATCHAHPTLLGFNTPMIFGEKYRSWKSSNAMLPNLLLPLPSWAEHLPQQYVLEHPHILASLNATKFRTHIKRKKLQFSS